MLLASLLALGSVALAEEKPKSAGRELVETAKAYGRGDTRVPPVNGICVDEKGKTTPCAVSLDGPLYAGRITGGELCRDEIQQALDDLREVVLARMRAGERTGARAISTSTASSCFWLNNSRIPARGRSSRLCSKGGRRTKAMSAPTI